MPSKTKRKKRAKGVDYGFATQTARDFIQLYNVDWLPVDVFELVDKYAEATNQNIQIKTIEDLSFETKIDRQSLIDDVIYGEDGLAIYDPDTETYSIIINEKAEPYGRIRWTVVHELAHIVLGHLSNSKTSIVKWQLSEEEYNDMEQEAHIFAGEVLSPKFIIYRIGAHSSAEIQDICGLSIAASDSRENAIFELINDKRKMHDSMLTIIPTFAQFLEFKTICTEKDKMRIKSRITQNTPAEKQLSILKVNVTSKGKYERCPYCGNNHNADAANFCKLCGSSLFEAQPLTPSTPCGKIGDKDASFCDHCGNIVYKTRFGLLFDKDEL